MSDRFRHFPAVLSGILCLLLLFSPALPLFAEGEGAVPALSFGIPGVEGNRTLGGSEVFEDLYGEGILSDAERAFLDGERRFTLTYSDVIPESTVSTYYDNGLLTVTVAPYSYVAENGCTVCWIPVSADLSGVGTRELTPGAGGYGCSFEELYYSADFDMNVTYALTLEIPEETAGVIRDAARQAGAARADEEAAWAEAMADYDRRTEAYEAYQRYLADCDAYRDYLGDYAAYLDELAVYETYLGQYAGYMKELADYRAWNDYVEALRQYYAYEKFREEELSAYQEYSAYREQIRKIDTRLNILESLFTTDSHGWNLYNSLMGPTVSAVVANKDKLIAAQCSEKDIERADRATRNLREMMREYAGLRDAEYASEYEKKKALYAFYTGRYGELCQNFGDLYGALYGLYDSNLVYQELKNQGKDEHYKQFVGQLYVTITCLDDTIARDGAWKIRGKTLDDVVENAQRLRDSDQSAPAGAEFPAKEIPPVTPVEPAAHPGAAPRRVDVLPEEPARVPEPEAPAPVDDPSLGTVPPEAAHPGDAPLPPEENEILSTLAADYREGKLPPRDSLDANRTLTFERTVLCEVSVLNLKTVSFYDAEGTTLLYRVKVDYGESAVYLGADVTQKTSPEYEYQFRAFVTLPELVAPDLSSVTENLTLYAYYTVTPKYYDVTWLDNGTSQTAAYRYGEIPVPPAPGKKETAEFFYPFEGWSPEILPVTGDAEYTARYGEEKRSYTVTWQTASGTQTTEVLYGELPIPPDGLLPEAGNERWEFLGWNQTLLPVTGDASYTARYRHAPFALLSDGTVLPVLHTGDALTVASSGQTVYFREAAAFCAGEGKELRISWDTGLTFVLSPEDAETVLASAAAGIRLGSTPRGAGATEYFLTFTDASGRAVPCPSVSPSVIFSPTAGETRIAWYDLSGNRAAPGIPIAWEHASFLCRKVFPVEVLTNEFCNPLSLPDSWAAGETVHLLPECAFGYEVTGAVVRTADGREVVVKDLSFVMPDSPVTVTFTVERIRYHVTFTVRGEIVSEADYFLGDAILPPSDPADYTDGEDCYLFAGWSGGTFLAAGENRTLVFDASFVPAGGQANPYESTDDNNALFTKVLPCVLAGIVLLAAAIVIFRNRKKIFARLSAKAPERSEEAPPAEVPEEIAEEISEDIPDDVPTEVTENVTEDVPEEVPEEMPADVPKNEDAGGEA